MYAISWWPSSLGMRKASSARTPGCCQAVSVPHTLGAWYQANMLAGQGKVDNLAMAAAVCLLLCTSLRPISSQAEDMATSLCSHGITPRKPCKVPTSLSLGLQLAQSRSYFHTLRPKVSIIYILGALGYGHLNPWKCWQLIQKLMKARQTDAAGYLRRVLVKD